ncbi:hypothetical protein [Mycoplasma suis]|uniref:Uncharacterized protein n=2 Tax=Mycoplasma suis TaxID=57372 RepID=F0QQH1_MYCSL|nr:hypothetical protein [Mycoplasma suis]ADX97741.1 hypothetical protein MSU_0197 [Mycoplasma suis str. Illinois]CBZ40291.1 hypothetical protein MSUIS_01980 [Mycoplasma suis KI3806]
MVFSGIKIIPLTLGLSGIVAGGSFSLTSYLMNGKDVSKKNFFEKSSSSKRDLSGQHDLKNSQDTQNLGKDAKTVIDGEETKDQHSTEDLSSGIKSSSLEGENDFQEDSTLEESTNKDLESHFPSDEGLENSHLDDSSWDIDPENPINKKSFEDAKSNSKIIAEHIYSIYRSGYEESRENLETFCEYWENSQQLEGKLVPKDECQKWVETEIKFSGDHPIMWLRANQNNFEVIFEKYFHHPPSSMYSDALEEDKEIFWTYGDGWNCSTTKKSESIIASCEKKEKINNFPSSFQWNDEIDSLDSSGRDFSLR